MLVQVIEWVTVVFERIVGIFGLPGISLVAFLENVFPPTPSEYIYPLAGKMAHDYGISPLLVIVAGVSGTLLGALCFYGLGYWLGEARVRRLVAKYGIPTVFGVRLRLMHVDDFDRAVALFERRGPMIVLIGRTMPYIHGIVSIPAGVVRMPLLPFLAYSALGAASTTTVLVLFGYFLGANWDRMLYWLDIYENVWLALLLSGGLAFLGYRLLRARGRARISAEEA